MRVRILEIGETLRIGDEVFVTLSSVVTGQRVRLGVEAPDGHAVVSLRLEPDPEPSGDETGALKHSPS